MRRRVRLVLHDQPQNVRAFADRQIGDRGDERRAAARLPLDDRRLDPGADAHRQAHMGLAARLKVLQFQRRRQRRAGCDIHEPAVADEGSIQKADGVVIIQRMECRREAAVGQLPPGSQT